MAYSKVSPSYHIETGTSALSRFGSIAGLMVCFSRSVWFRVVSQGLALRHLAPLVSSAQVTSNLSAMASIRMRTPSPSPMVSRSGHVSRVVSPARSAGPPLYLRTKRDPLVVSVITIPGHPAPPVYAARLPPAMPVRQCPPFATPRRVRPGQREMGAASSPALQTPPKEARPPLAASHEPLPNLLQRRKPDTEEPPDYDSPKAGPETRELQAMQQEHEAGEKEQQTQLQDEAGPAMREQALQEQQLHFEQRLQEKEDAHKQACKALQLEHEQALKAEEARREQALEEQQRHYQTVLQETRDALEQTVKEQRLNFEQLLQDQGLQVQRLLQEIGDSHEQTRQAMRLEFEQALEAEKALRGRVLQDSREQTMEAMRLEYEQALEAEKALRERALQEQQLNFEQLLKDARQQAMEADVPRQPAAAQHLDSSQEAAAVSAAPRRGKFLLPAEAGASAEEKAAHFKEALACYRQRYDGRTPDASQLATFSANMGFPVTFKLAKELLWARRRR
ncbi:unnamed protein product [Symbiodinium natans]|uniref:Uncharacterized protein n=1 Tax=Symbiodinium natans TaxID=878477 RepID=A0A812RDF4_9DINO|nr:unnamed protein product [Symbiodinium natans]